MSEYYHRFARFVDEPRKGETLREFVERECFHRAEMVEQMIEELPEGKSYLLDIDTALYGAMPVNFYVYTSNYSIKNGEQPDRLDHTRGRDDGTRTGRHGQHHPGARRLQGVNLFSIGQHSQASIPPAEGTGRHRPTCYTPAPGEPTATPRPERLRDCPAVSRTSGVNLLIIFLPPISGCAPRARQDLPRPSCSGVLSLHADFSHESLTA